MADETKNETVSDLADLKDIAGDAPQGDAADIAATADVPLREQELDKEGRAYATGRRKDATARVWLKPGSGKVIVNGKDQEVYFARPTLRLIIDQPFTITDRQGQYDVVATVRGGGLSARPVRSSTASRRRSPSTSHPAQHGQGSRSSPVIAASSSVRSTAAPRHAAASSSRSAKPTRSYRSPSGAVPRGAAPFHCRLAVQRWSIMKPHASAVPPRNSGHDQ